jgi:hypothetical protein
LENNHMTDDQIISLAATMIAIVAMIVANIELRRALREIDKPSSSRVSLREEAASEREASWRRTHS